MSGAAKVIIQEWDYSTRVPSFPGLYGAIVVPAKKGRPDYPVLCTSETQYLQYYTPDETIRVGDDLSHYDALAFLEKSNKLWVLRAAENPLYGGCYLMQDKPIKTFKATVNLGLYAFTLRQVTAEEIATAKLAWASLTNGDVVRVAPDDSGTLPSPLTANTDYYVIKYDADTYQIQVARTREAAYAGEFILIKDTGSGNVEFTVTSNKNNGELEYGLSDPDTYQMGSSDGRMAGLTSQFTVDVNDSAFNVSENFYNTCATLDVVRLIAGSGGEFPEVAVGGALNATTDYYIVKLSTELDGVYKVKLARSLVDAGKEVTIDFLTAGSPGLQLNLTGKAISSETTLNFNTDAFTVTTEFFNTVAKNDKVKLSVSSGGKMPAVTTGNPVTSDKEYFVIKGVSNTIQIATTTGGTAINFSDAGTGTLTFTVSGKVIKEQVAADLSDDTITVSETFYEAIQTGYKVRVSSTGTLPGGLSASSDYFVYVDTENGSPNKIKLARTAQEAQLGIGVDVLDAGEGEHTIVDKHNEELTGLDRKCILVYTSTPCEEELYVETLHYPYGDASTWTDDEKVAAETVGTPGCFKLYVYKKNSNGEYYQVENPYLLSRAEDAKDGYGSNIYCEEAIKSSRYVRIKDNKAVDSSILPKDQGQLLKLTKGSNGSTVTDASMTRALNVLKSKRKYSVTVIMDGGWATPAYGKAIISLCEGRQDCVGLLSVPISAELNSDYLNEVKKYRNELLNANTSYAALYTPHLKISDRFNDREIYVSPTGYVAGCISDNEQNREIWYAPAGPKYGVLNVLDVARRYDEGELDDLYNAGINPIDFYEGRGIRVWGQKTLQSSASALDRLNVRLMLIVIEPAIAEFLEDFLFDQNDDITRRLVTESIKSYMEGIKARRGVYAYDVKCDSENNTDEDIDANQMNVWLYVQPTKTVEYIKFRVIITRTGASFSIE